MQLALGLIFGLVIGGAAVWVVVQAKMQTIRENQIPLVNLRNSVPEQVKSLNRLTGLSDRPVYYKPLSSERMMITFK